MEFDLAAVVLIDLMACGVVDTSGIGGMAGAGVEYDEGVREEMVEARFWGSKAGCRLPKT